MSQVVGTLVVYLTPTGIKIAVKKLGLKVMATGPEWKVLLSNDLNKVFYECPLQQFRSFANKDEALVSGNLYESLPFVKDTRVQMLHLDAIKYKTPLSLAVRAKAEHKEGLTDNGAVQSAYYCLADKLPVPQQEGLIMEKFYGLTVIKGVPLEFRYVNLVDEHRSRLYSSLCQGRAIPLSEFARPNGYRAVKSMQEVWVDTSQSEGFNDMMEGLGHLAK